MADNIFGDGVLEPSTSNIFDEEEKEQPQTTDSDNDQDINTLEQENPFNDAELNDYNAINVNIVDATSPLIILFGPPSSGKTMTLVRLTRFLSRQDYIVAPVRNFRPTYDKNYTAICDGFDNLINSDHAAASTNKINFMLVEVMKHGKRICQILEAPGELYFDHKEPKRPFPNFLNEILNRNNRKIWTILVEPNWLQPSDRRNYVSKIHKLKTRLRAKDKTVIVYNKIDQTNYVASPGHVQIGGAQKDVRDLYPGLLELYKNNNPLFGWLKPLNCDFVPFQTGDYSVSANGKLTFQEGPDEYPRMLWNVIMKKIRG